ncbi:flagellar export protein FliJ [Brevibacillus massiliensis]|jgi:flagellar FliJ protein|uniref:flagellar export protein FliJ n=1 Tax=Brevibacillus massiliensis TaxID=1118054 RepID=UPI00031B9311|nr:flagellar export protein FliJ [Brevibacillus massiliensis]
MSTFRFQLQKIVDLKEKEKEQAEWAFGLSQQRKAEEEQKLMQLDRHREEVTQSLFELQHQSCSAAQLMEIARYRHAVERAIATQKKTLFGCEQELERCKRRLTFHMQESKLWERMREKAKEQFEDSERKREQKELDEMGVARYIQRVKQA